jgi:hypothetical protein
MGNVNAQFFTRESPRQNLQCQDYIHADGHILASKTAAHNFLQV